MKVIVPTDLDGARLDRAAAALFPQHSRSFVARLIDEGRVTLDGSRVTKPSHRVAAGETIEVDVPPAAPPEIISQNLPLERMTAAGLRIKPGNNCCNVHRNSASGRGDCFAHASDGRTIKPVGRR